MQIYKRVALLGATANPNIGDEAILTANIQKIRKMYGTNCKIYVFTKDSTYTAVYNGEYGQIIPVDYLHKFSVSCNYDADELASKLEEIVDAKSSNIFQVEYETIHNVFKEIDVLHIIGGGYINTLWPDMLYEVYIATLLCRKYEKRYFLTGISTYPFDDKYIEILQEILINAEFVEFRDDSYLNLDFKNRCNIIEGLDDAISLDDYYLNDNFNEYATLLFHNWKGNVDNVVSMIQTQILPFVEKCLNEGIVKKIIILGFSIDDLNIWETISFSEATLSHIEFINCCTQNCVYAKHIIANAKFNIGSRFHQAVFSLSAKKPILSIYYDQYYCNKLESIHKNFNSNLFVSIDNITKKDFDNLLEEIDNPKLDSIDNIEIIRKQFEKNKHICDVYGINQTDREILLAKLNNGHSLPKISVIIPIYNMDAYLRECLDSVLSQTLDQLEIICVNDGSTDYTQLILDEYSWRDSRIKVIPQTNHGVAYARNIAIESARGEFLYFLDPDDWLPDKNVLSDMYNAAKKSHTLVCGGSFKEYASRGIIDHWDGNLSKYTFKKDEIIKYKDYQFDYGWVRFIYNRDFIIYNDLRIPALKFFEDPVFFVRVMHEAKEFYAMKRCTYCYRTGHKTSDIPYNKVVDLLTGLYMNICFAKEHNYSQLMALEIARIEDDYAGFITKYLLNSDSYELRSIFEKINQLLYDNNQRLEYRLYNKLIKNKEAEIWHLNQTLERNTVHAEHEFNRIRQEFYNSTTWKLGDIFLFIPKLLKRKFSGR